MDGFEQMLENCLKGNTQELHIHTNGSGKTIDWWWRLFKKVADYRKINERIEDMVVWYFALDGLLKNLTSIELTKMADKFGKL